MDLQPLLENDLVKIRPMNYEDCEPLYEIAKAHRIWEQHPCKRYLRTEFDKYFIESIESKGALIILDKTDDKIIGSSRYKKIDGFPNGIEIGWTFLDRKYWGGRHNKAVKQLMINHAFEFVDNIILYVDKTNLRSQRAVEKINGKKLLDSEHPKLSHISSDNITYVIKKSQRKT